eukprot:1896695-Prymnesium_polylepis.1
MRRVYAYHPPEKRAITKTFQFPLISVPPISILYSQHQQQSLICTSETGPHSGLRPPANYL